MRKLDTEKTADELLSDSCFDLLATCNNRISSLETKLAALREAAKGMKWGTDAERTNYLAQRYACGELLGLSYMQGALGAQCKMKTELAVIARLLKEVRLPCGCYGKCDPYAHDTAPDWDGTPDGPYYTRCPECDGKIYEDDHTEHTCV